MFTMERAIREMLRYVKATGRLKENPDERRRMERDGERREERQAREV